MLKKTYRALSLLAIVSLSLTQLREPFAKGDDSKVIRGHLVAEPVSLDPAHADDDYSLRVLANTMDGLTGYDSEGHLEKRLGESYTITNAGRRYTFKIRHAFWSDGHAVTAHDFVVGFRRTLSPSEGAKLASLLFMIKNAKDVYTGKAKPETLGVQEKDGQVIIDLEKPVGYFPHVLTIPPALPLREDILKANNEKWPDTAPTTGAYKITAHHRGDSISLEPSLTYWNHKTSAKPVELKIIGEDSTSLNLLLAGKLDYVTRVRGADCEGLKAKKMLQVFPQVSTYFISFNMKKEPFNHKEFRKAVASVLDRKAIAALVKAEVEPAKTWIPPGLEGYETFGAGPKIDIQARDAAKKDFAAKPKAVTAAYNDNEMNSIVMQKLQNDLNTTLGLRVDLRAMEWTSYVNQIRTDAPQLYRFGRGASFMDPYWHLVSFTCHDPNNPTGWCNAEYDHLVDEIGALPSGRARQAKIHKAQTLLTDEESAVIPLFFQRQTIGISPRLKGLKANPMTVVNFQDLILD